MTVGDYCLFYECSDESWKIRAEACLCLEEEKISEIDSQIPSNLKRCCAGIKGSFINDVNQILTIFDSPDPICHGFFGQGLKTRNYTDVKNGK